MTSFEAAVGTYARYDDDDVRLRINLECWWVLAFGLSRLWRSISVMMRSSCEDQLRAQSESTSVYADMPVFH